MVWAISGCSGSLCGRGMGLISQQWTLLLRVHMSGVFPLSCGRVLDWVGVGFGGETWVVVSGGGFEGLAASARVSGR